MENNVLYWEPNQSSESEWRLSVAPYATHGYQIQISAYPWGAAARSLATTTSSLIGACHG
ncbi:protein of unknown function [Magnetospira sp. QH-2]|nr:protein of unknown function [Magnetospira sp. QH-2]